MKDNTSQAHMTYADSGVNIDAGNTLVDRIKPIVKTTARPGSDTDLGGFGGLFDIAKAGYNDPILVSATDGVGTKLKIAETVGKHDTIGIDLVAMCVNDLVVQGAQPLFFLDYFATGKLEVEQAEDVISGIADGCRQSGCALVGGETAEMPGMYAAGTYDLAGFTVGAVERDSILPRKNITQGDSIIGIASTGVHSNGFSLVRKVLERSGLSLDDTPKGFGNSLGETLLTPTRIYVKSCLAAIETGYIKAFAHITGGGLLENIPRVLPNELAAEINYNSWEIPLIFQWVQKNGAIDTLEMLRAFNCGIGMIAIVSDDKKEDIIRALEENGETCHVIGQITERKTDTEAVTFTNLP